MQLGGFFVLATAGIMSGFIYEIGSAINHIFKNRIYIKTVVDFFASVSMGAIFFIAELRYLNFNHMWVGLACFIFGLCIERISLGFLLAKSFNGIYNVAIRLMQKVKKTKIIQRSLK